MNEGHYFVRQLLVCMDMCFRVVGNVPAGHLERTMPHKLREGGLVRPAQYLSGGIIVAQGIGWQKGNARPDAQP